MTTAELLALFGSTKELSVAVGAKESNIRMWKVNGIPPRWHHPLVEAARHRGLANVTHELLASLPKPDPQPRKGGARTAANDIGAEASGNNQSGRITVP